MPVQLVGVLRVFLVEPVRGDAEIGRPVHLARPDLNLVQLSSRTEHRGVQ